MTEPTIICPNCKTEIKLTESLAAYRAVLRQGADRRYRRTHDRGCSSAGLQSGKNRGRLLQVPQQDRARRRARGAAGLPGAEAMQQRRSVALRKDLLRGERHAAVSGGHAMSGPVTPSGGLLNAETTGMSHEHESQRVCRNTRLTRKSC